MPIPMDDSYKHYKTTLTLPATNTFQENVFRLAAHYNKTTQPGHGLFFDFSHTPEYEKPVLDELCQRYSWILEKPFFIRKQEARLN